MLESVQFFVGMALLLAASVFLIQQYFRRERISKRVVGQFGKSLPDSHAKTRETRFDYWISRMVGSTHFYRNLKYQLEVSRVSLSPARVIAQAAGWLLFGLLLGFSAQGLAGMLIAGILFPAIRLYLPQLSANKRRARFQDQLDYSLNLFSASIRSGHSLVKAIEIVAIQSEAPTSEEFSKALNSMRLGRDIGDSLLQIADRMRSQELEWVVQSINIHRESGGNLTEMFETVVSTIKDRNAIRVLIRTLSTDGRVSGQVMSILPIGVVAVFTLQNPTAFRVFIDEPIGNLLLAIAGTMYLAGIFWIRKIVKVKF
jgi:tight adherence protein B